ncbi:MAG: 3-methyl-2-oxobutanoate hydroxymethyltransferase [bacterium]
MSTKSTGKVTIPGLKQMKQNNQKITMLTAYDYPTAVLLDTAGIDILLVGDSLGMVALGYENTLPVTMEEMLHHTKAVKRGCKRGLIVGDMPFLSFNMDSSRAIENAGRFIKEGGAGAVKLEGAMEPILRSIRCLVEAGIAVMGHIGLTPQLVHQMGGFKVQGREKESADLLSESAGKLEEAGVFALVLEGIPADLARNITRQIAIPTIGIGAGPHCDGQVLVTPDLLGLSDAPKPKFVKQYASLHTVMLSAIRSFRQEVLEGKFPSDEYSYH